MLRTVKRAVYALRRRARSASDGHFHFVQEYEELVEQLVAKFPLDEAMSRAVGGQYETFGRIQSSVLKGCGLSDGMRLVDLACGSGRLASVLHKEMKISYVGIDIVRRLLDYAKSRAPGYEFIRHRELSIPQPDASADMVSSFSLFTHLLHEESYIYLEECRRILRPGGRVVFSFWEFGDPAHWETFMVTRRQQLERTLPHLNVFIERDVVGTWARHIGLEVVRFIAGSEPDAEGRLHGQTIAVLGKPG